MAMNQHKRLAMGAKTQGYAKGGAIGSTPAAGVARAPAVGIGSPSKAAMPRTPLVDARTNNGIPGMKKGGAAKKSGGKC